MLDTLKFVRGAVADKDLVPVLTHFNVYDGRIQGGNGRIYIDAPCPELAGFNFTVPADRFLRAVDTCGGEPRFKLKDGHLTVSRGKFRAKLPVGDPELFPISSPDVTGKKRVDLEFLKDARPFIGQDASRPWACGVLLCKAQAYATNNIVLVTHPVKWPKRRAILPSFAVDELYRIGLDYDIKVADSDNTLTFHYDDGSWLKTSLFHDEGWPPSIGNMLKPCKTKLNPKVTEAVKQILPFCPDTKTPIIEFSEGGVSTMEGDVSAVVDVGKLNEAYFRAEPLMTVLDVATHFDWSNYPKPCPFKNDVLQGIIVGVRP